MLLQNLIKKVISFTYRTLPYKNGLNNTENRKSKIIVSLTSYPERVKLVPIAIKSILYQSMKPDKIILYLSQEECSDMLLKEIRPLEQYGLIIRTVADNLKPHNKYFYCMQEYLNDIVITIDDDVIYPPQMIKTLYNYYLKYPNCIIASRVHHITTDTKGALKPYNEWDYEYKKCLDPSHSLIATGVGGVLYPPHILSNLAYNKEKIIELCLNADDIWLKYMEILNGKKVIYAKNANNHRWYIDKSSKQGLAISNVQFGQNDIYIKQMSEYYGISLEKFV